MALPALLQKLFKSSGYGPELNDELVSRYISVQDWSGSYDYAVATLARGSDGLIYRSIAQSGPGTGAGAQNPVNDSAHAYWGALPMPTMPLGNSSSSGATTQWVKDLAAAPVYLNPNGSDSSDGMTAATAVQTFARAAQIAKNLPQDIVTLFVAAGTYTGNLDIRTQNLRIELAGDVTLNGTVNVEAGYVEVFGNYTLTIRCGGTSYAVRLIGGSIIDFKCTLTVTASSFITAIMFICQHDSALYFGKPVTVDANVEDSVFYISHSYCEFFDTLSINGTKANSAIVCDNCAVVTINEGISVSDIITSNCINLNSNSVCHITTPSGSTSTLRNGINSYATVILYHNSFLDLSGSGTLKIYHKGFSWGGCINAQESVVISNTNLDLNASSCSAFISSSNRSDVRLDSGSCKFTGTVTDGMFNCNFVSMMTIMAGVSLTGSPNGKKFSVSWNSTIFTQGRNLDTMPGTGYDVYSDLYGLQG